MTEVSNAYAEALGRTTTASTTVGAANKVRLTHTPRDNETWAYLWSCTLDCNQPTLDAVMRLRNETASEDWANTNIEPRDGNNNHAIGGLKTKAYGASPGSQDIDIDFWCEGTSTVGCSNGRIFGLKLDANDFSEASDAEQSSTSETYAAAVTLTETMTGDYLILCSAEINTGASHKINIRADHDGTKYGSHGGTHHDSTTYRTWATAFKLTGLTGSKTITVEFATSAAASGVNVRNARILAIKLSRFNANDSAEDRTRTTTSSTTAADKSSLTYTPASERNHVAIGCMILDYNSTALSLRGEFERDGTAFLLADEELNASLDTAPLFCAVRESLTTGDKVYKTQYWSESVTNATGADESFIIVIDLEEVATPVGAAASNLFVIAS